MARYVTPEYIRKMRTEGLKKNLMLEDKSPGRKFLIKGWKFLVALVTLFGLFQGFAMFVPQISLAATEPENEDVMSAPFIVTNSSSFSLYKLEMSCRISMLNTDAFATESDLNNVQYMPTIPELDSQQSGSIYCRNGMGLPGKTTFADVTIAISYRPGWAPWYKRERSFRFVTTWQKDDSLRWIPKAFKQL